jgi:hypothetical protein
LPKRRAAFCAGACVLLLPRWLIVRMRQTAGCHGQTYRLRFVNRPVRCAPQCSTHPCPSSLERCADRTPSWAPSGFLSHSPTLALACGCSRQLRLHRPLRFVFVPYLKGPEGLQPIIAGESASKAARFYSGRCILAKERADEEWSVKPRSITEQLEFRPRPWHLLLPALTLSTRRFPQSPHRGTSLNPIRLRSTFPPSKLQFASRYDSLGLPCLSS